MQITSRLFKTTFLSGSLALLPITAAMAAPVFDKIDNGFLNNGTGADNTKPLVNGSTTIINQNSNRLDLSWKDFSSNAGESIVFNQPNSGSIAINRVTSTTPSILAGAMSANGNIVVINPYGITFTNTGQVNVGGLMATTAKSVTEKDLSATERLITFDKATGKIENNGTINAKTFVFMVSPTIKNTGTIKVENPGGYIGLGAYSGSTMTLSTPQSGGTIKYLVQGNAFMGKTDLAKASIDNTGTLQAKSGIVVLSAQQATNLQASVINLSGVVDVSSFGTGYVGGQVQVGSSYTQDLKVKLSQANVDVNINGKIIADDANNSSLSGGVVVIDTKGDIKLASQSEISANGKGDGGAVGVYGGTVQSSGLINVNSTGSNSGAQVAGTKNVTVDQSSTINANGKDYGYGGEITVISTKGTVVDNGTLNANTGANGYAWAGTGHKNIYIEGLNKVTIGANAKLSSQGGKGGGFIYIDSAKKDVAQAGDIYADATGAGEGGLAYIRAKGKIATGAGATYSAIGGLVSGDGGGVIFEAGKAKGLTTQISAATTDVSAPHGESGSVDTNPYAKQPNLP